jgi:RIO kinase 2
MEAVEKGMKNHALVPLPLITSIANLRHGGVNKIISSLIRDNLLSHHCRKQGYDGYRITNAGYDILALHNLKSRGFVAALGTCLQYCSCMSRFKRE